MKQMSYPEYAATFREPTPVKYLNFLEGLITLTYAIPPKYFIVKENRFAAPEEEAKIQEYFKNKEES